MKPGRVLPFYDIYQISLVGKGFGFEKPFTPGEEVNVGDIGFLKVFIDGAKTSSIGKGFEFGI
jgi:hypothetical protein